MTAWTITLYAIGAACELAAVYLTYRDLSSKAGVWTAFMRPRAPANVRQVMIEAAAASKGQPTWEQLQRINEPLSVALEGATLKKAGALLTIGILIGTAANILGALR